MENSKYVNYYRRLSYDKTDKMAFARQPRAIVEFSTAGRKTLTLQYANLEPAA